VNLADNLDTLLGLLFILLFFGLILAFYALGRRRPGRNLRDIPAFKILRRAIGLSVEEGTRLHVSVGRGNLSGPQGSAAIAGLTVLKHSAHAASISDSPPVATSGDGAVTILTQDTIRSTYSDLGAQNQYEATNGQLTGLTPFSYAAGAIPVIHDENVTANVIVGHLGSEIVLLTEEAERRESLTVAGTDSVPTQAVTYAASQEPLLGEEIYAGGAYIGSDPIHIASLRAQDVLRWLLAGIILIGALAKLGGLL
jgi:hypothetical protein